MVFVWRGLGIIVPIVFFICGWIVSYFYDDTRLGNPSFLGWTCFYAAIVLLLPGLGAFFSDPDEDGVKRKHDFFFIPILFWSLGLGVLCAYLLLSRGPDTDDLSVDDLKTEMSQQDQQQIKYRTVNFLNSSNDSLEMIITEEDGSTDRFIVGPKSWSSRDLEPKQYVFSCYDMNDKLVSNFPVKTKLGKPTTSELDYDAGWIQMDGGEHKLILLDVTEMIPDEYRLSDLKKADWTTHIVEVYNGQDLMQPAIPDTAGVYAMLLEPGDLLPNSDKASGEVYALITVPADEKLTNEFLQKRLTELYFE